MTMVTDPAAVQQVLSVTGGVDTHADVHVAAVIDAVGRELGHREFATTPVGYAALLAWLGSLGPLELVGVEGTGMYGAGLTRVLQAAGVTVVEVDRPDRKARRFQGKSDPIDAFADARAALSGRASGTPKTRTGTVEMIRTLRVARSGAVKAKAVAWNQLKALIKTTPDELRERLRALTALPCWTTALVCVPPVVRLLSTVPTPSAVVPVCWSTPARRASAACRCSPGASARWRPRSPTSTTTSNR